MALPTPAPSEPPRFVSRAGGTDVVRSGVTPRRWHDLYHSALNARWWALLATFAGFYVVVNALFALAYIAGGDDIANARANQILEAQVHLALARTETTAEGERVRRLYDLELVRTRTPLFVLTWTVIHPIDERSPIFGATQESLRTDEGEIVVSVTGIDETFSQTIYARYSYLADEIVWDARFADVMSVLPDGRRLVDYSRFHDVVSLQE